MVAMRRTLALLAFLVAARSPAAAQKPLPPLPTSIPSALGPVPIVRVPQLKCDGEPAFGCFEPERFVVSIRDSIALAVAWQTIRHERFHVLLFVAGIHLSGPEGVEDLLADATATQDVLEMRTPDGAPVGTPDGGIIIVQPGTKPDSLPTPH